LYWGGGGGVERGLLRKKRVLSKKTSLFMRINDKDLVDDGEQRKITFWDFEAMRAI
jgi:hypothetical protein